MKLSSLILNRKSSADLATAITESQALLSQAQQSAAALRERRAAALLDASDGDVDSIERELQIAERNVERLEVAALELARRHNQAAAAEERARLDDLRQRALAARAATQAGLADYRKRAVKLGDLALAIEENRRAFNELRGQLRAAGAGDDGLEEPEYELAMEAGRTYYGVSLERLYLPDPADLNVPIYKGPRA